jgi:hypothetical protein
MNKTKNKAKQAPNPCSCCKSKKVGVEILNPYENDRAVVCDDCGLTGPIAGQHDWAIQAWNDSSKKSTA